MAEKGETKIIAIITICIMLISIGLSGCVDDDNNKKDEYEVYLKISIVVSVETNYTLFIPIPVKSALHYKPDNYSEPIDFISNMQ